MAEARIIQQLGKFIKQYSDSVVRDAEGKENLHRVTITSIESAGSLVTGTSKALDIIFANDPTMKEIFEKSNTKDEWRRQLARVFEGFLKNKNTDIVGLKVMLDTPIKDFYTFRGENPGNMYMKANSTRERFIIELRTPSTYRTIYVLCRHIKKVAWTNWVNDIKNTNPTTSTAPDMLNNKKANMARGQETTFAHNKGSEIGLGRLHEVAKAVEKMDPSGDIYFIQESVNLAHEIFRRATLDMVLTPIQKKNVLTGEKREVSGTLGPNIKSIGDFRGLKKKIMGTGTGSLKTWLTKNKKTAEMIDPSRAMDAKGSRTLKQDVAASNARALVGSITNSMKKAGVRGKAVKVLAPLKTRKVKKVTYNHKSSSRTKINKGVMRLGTGSVYEIKSSQEKGRPESSLVELTKLKKLINKRLPAEVRRNMGRPALINQTGRFSNSTQVLSLRETAAGLGGEYTYQKSPYETFENTGSRKWPTGYNPKPLIAKSIRNLALQYTKQKLVSLRRI